MRSVTRSRRWAVAYLAVFAILFAPAMDEGRAGSTGRSERALDARILAPTVREAMEVADPKPTLRHLQMSQRRLRPESLPLAVASFAAALHAWVLYKVGTPSGTGPRLIFFRALIPRGPPALPAL